MQQQQSIHADLLCSHSPNDVPPPPHPSAERIHSRGMGRRASVQYLLSVSLSIVRRSMQTHMSLTFIHDRVSLLIPLTLINMHYTGLMGILFICFQNQDNNDMRSLQRIWRCRLTNLILGSGGVKISTRNRPLSPHGIIN